MVNSKRTRDFHKRVTRERRDRRIREWQEARDAHLAAVNWKCEIGPLLAEHGVAAYLSCIGRAVTCHHALARGMGGSLDNSTLLAACDPCHTWTEANPRIATRIGAKVLHDY